MPSSYFCPMQTPSLSLRDFSIYRSELMGLSILWIMMLHFTFQQISPLGVLSQFGYAGVEIFFLVSGLGLYVSLDKDSHLTHFYRKRLLRIFPTYFILGSISSLLLYHDDLITYLFRHTTIGFWTGGPYADWFIPSILLLYLIAPLCKRLVDSSRRVTIALSVLILAVTYLLIDKDSILPRTHFFLIYRIPAFILGMTIARWLKYDSTIRPFFLLLLLGLPFFCWFYPHHHEVYNYKYFSVLFLLPAILICFTLLSKYARFLSPLTASMGRASLEIYLIQGILFSATLKGIIVIPPSWHDIASISFITLSIVLGIAVHWAFNRLTFSLSH